MLLQNEYYVPDFNVVEREDVDESIEEIIKPHDEFLLSKGFVYQSALMYDNPQYGLELDHYLFYYYNYQNGVHAFINTMPEKGSLEGANITYDTFYESGNICMSTDGFKYYIAVLWEGVYSFDHYYGSFEDTYNSHLKDREMENESIVKIAFSKEGLKEFEESESQRTIEAYYKAGLIKYTKNGYRFKPSLALWKYVKKFIRGYDKFAKILKEKKTPAQYSESNEKSHQLSQKQALATQYETQEKPREQNNKVLWFIISMFAFVVIFALFGIPMDSLVMIIVILFVHESGHLFAMRSFGYTDTSIFFIPMFGAAAIGKKEKTTAFQEYIIYLAGPLPGMLLGLAIIIYLLFAEGAFGGDTYLGMYAIMSIVINYINLLPIYPLDGGKIVQTLLLLRYPRGQFYFYLVSLAFIIISIFWLQNVFIVIFALALLVALKQNYLLSTLLQKLLSTKSDSIDKEMISEILSTDEKYKKESLASKTSLLKQSLKVMQSGKPSKRMTMIGLALYLLLLVPPLVGAYYVKSSMDAQREEFLYDADRNESEFSKKELDDSIDSMMKQ